MSSMMMSALLLAVSASRTHSDARGGCTTRFSFVLPALRTHCVNTETLYAHATHNMCLSSQSGHKADVRRPLTTTSRSRLKEKKADYERM